MKTKDRLIEIEVAHIYERIDSYKYNVEAWERNRVKLLQTMRELHCSLEIMVKDCITVFDNDEDMCFYTVDHRSIMISENEIFITYWVKDLK